MSQNLSNLAASTFYSDRTASYIHYRGVFLLSDTSTGCKRCDISSRSEPLCRLLMGCEMYHEAHTLGGWALDVTSVQHARAPVSIISLMISAPSRRKLKSLLLRCNGNLKIIHEVICKSLLYVPSTTSWVRSGLEHATCGLRSVLHIPSPSLPLCM